MRKIKDTVVGKTKQVVAEVCDGIDRPPEVNIARMPMLGSQ
jgi:hypothetical protein